MHIGKLFKWSAQILVLAIVGLGVVIPAGGIGGKARNAGGKAAKTAKNTTATTTTTTTTTTRRTTSSPRAATKAKAT